MAGKQRSKRNIKKEVTRLFERSFDLQKLDYKRRSMSLSPKSMLVGLGVATLVYMGGFGLAYYGMNNNVVPLEGFAKLVWIMMIPTTIIGALAWQIAKNRMEYPIRQDVREYMHDMEKDGGTLWKFSPLMDIIGIDDMVTKRALSQSKEGNWEKMEIEDYTDAVFALNKALEGTENRSFSTVIAEAVLDNFGKLNNK